MGVQNANVLPQPWSDEYKPSLMSLLHKNKKLLAAIDKIPADLLEKSESALEKMIRADNKFGKFPRALGLLKIAFWDEYRRACTEKSWMRTESIFYGICTHQYWLTFVLENPMYIAWLIHPPGDEMLLQKELLGLGFKKLREAIEAPLYDIKYQNVKEMDENGVMQTVVKKIKTVNVPLIKEIHALVKTLQDRVHGAVIQKQQIAAVNVQMNATPAKNPDHISLADPNLSLEDLEKFENRLKGIAATIEGELPSESSEVINVESTEAEYSES